MELFSLYGKNNPLPKKMLVIHGLKLGKNFITILSELNVAEATAKVYGIDCLAAGADLDHESVAKCFKVSKESFDVIESEMPVMANEKKKLCTVWDNLGQLFSYNQIRLC